MYIISYFSNKGVPALGLRPVIDIWMVEDGSQVVSAERMEEIRGGFYRYKFSEYDDKYDYVIRADGGSSLLDEDRYTFASNEIGQVTNNIKFVPDNVWNEPLNQHQLPGSTGEALEKADATADPSAVAQAVWDEMAPSHSLDGSFAELIKRISGLCQDNYAVLNPVHDKLNNLTSGLIKIYPTANDVDNDTNALASFQINASYNKKGQLTNYKVKRL